MPREGRGSLDVDHLDTDPVARHDFHTRQLFEKIAGDWIGDPLVSAPGP